MRSQLIEESQGIFRGGAESGDDLMRLGMPMPQSRNLAHPRDI